MLARFGETGWLVAAMSIGGVLAGLIMWLVGARFSRGIVTLIAVSIGALVGLRMPHWFNSPLGAWATAVGGALLLGITGYALHRMWVGAGLAILLALWAGILLWNIYCSGRVGTFPDRVAGMGIQDYWTQVWNCLPRDFRRIGPFLCGLAVMFGITVSVFWSRAAAVMLYSVLGVSVLMIMGMMGIAISKPSLLGILPSQTGTQIATFGGMVLFGGIVQWLTGSRAVVEDQLTKFEPEKDNPIPRIAA
ncbi:MAG TPA: hypothetical protein VGP94_06970 [Tepidisphaeraceae bacterium]|nr:hypothetical protein [Tepidisphaeraceae bacterium]